MHWRKHPLFSASLQQSVQPVRASTQPCLTPFMTLNDSKTSLPTLTFAIIPVCSALIIVVNFSGHAYFLSSCHSPVIPTVSNALLKSTNTCVQWSVLLNALFCSCRRQNIISMVLWLPLKPHCVSGQLHCIIKCFLVTKQHCMPAYLISPNVVKNIFDSAYHKKRCVEVLLIEF